MRRDISGGRNPPGPKRERRPASNGAAHLTSTRNGNNGSSYMLAARRAQENRRQRRQRYIQRIWPLGDRVAFELLDHLISLFGLDDDQVDRVLDRFTGLDPVTLCALAADKLPPPPIHMGRR